MWEWQFEGPASSIWNGLLCSVQSSILWKQIAPCLNPKRRLSHAKFNILVCDKRVLYVYIPLQRQSCDEGDGEEEFGRGRPSQAQGPHNPAIQSSSGPHDPAVQPCAGPHEPTLQPRARPPCLPDGDRPLRWLQVERTTSALSTAPAAATLDAGAASLTCIAVSTAQNWATRQRETAQGAAQSASLTWQRSQVPPKETFDIYIHQFTTSELLRTIQN